MNAAAMIRGGCTVTTSPVRDVPSWRVRLRRLRRAKPYQYPLLTALQVMRDRVASSAFAEGLHAGANSEYRRARRASIRQARAFDRLIEALRVQERAR